MAVLHNLLTENKYQALDQQRLRLLPRTQWLATSCDVNNGQPPDSCVTAVINQSHNFLTGIARASAGSIFISITRFWKKKNDYLTGNTKWGFWYRKISKRTW
jgi:hypothetical protein